MNGRESLRLGGAGPAGAALLESGYIVSGVFGGSLKE